MMHLSKKMLFAIEAVVDIAYNASSRPAQSRDITRRQGSESRLIHVPEIPGGGDALPGGVEQDREGGVRTAAQFIEQDLEMHQVRFEDDHVGSGHG